MANNDYAIIVGIARYPQLGDLQGPENDARNFHKYLTQYAADKVPEAQATLVVSSQFAGTAAESAKPMLEEVDAAFRKLVDVAYEKKVGRRLWLFMAGHGFAPELRDAALLMANASSRVRYHLPGRFCADWFCAAGAFDEVILLMDCCRDDYPRTTPHPPFWDEIKRAGSDVRNFYGYATKWSRKSRETALPELFPVENGGAPASQVQGLFTHLLIRGLKGEATVSGGSITGATLRDYIHNQLDGLTVDGKSQNAEFVGDEMEDILFVEGAPPAQTKVTISGAPPNVRLEIWNSDKMLQFRENGDGPWEVALERGFYKVLAPQSGSSTLFEINGEETKNVQFPA